MTQGKKETSPGLFVELEGDSPFFKAAKNVKEYYMIENIKGKTKKGL